jgi:hypothetical protein
LVLAQFFQKAENFFRCASGSFLISEMIPVAPMPER